MVLPTRAADSDICLLQRRRHSGNLVDPVTLICAGGTSGTLTTAELGKNWAKGFSICVDAPVASLPCTVASVQHAWSVARPAIRARPQKTPL